MRRHKGRLRQCSPACFRGADDGALELPARRNDRLDGAFLRALWDRQHSPDHAVRACALDRRLGRLPRRERLAVPPRVHRAAHRRHRRMEPDDCTAPDRHFNDRHFLAGVSRGADLGGHLEEHEFSAWARMGRDGFLRSELDSEVLRS